MAVSVWRQQQGSRLAVMLAWHSHYRKFVSVFLFLIGQFAMLPAVQAQPQSGTPVTLSDEIRQRILTEYAAKGREDIRARALSDFYQEHDYRSIWFGRNGPQKIQALLHALEHIDREGLNPRDYRWAALGADCLEAVNPDQAGCELTLSGTLMTYARDVGYGRYSPSQLDPQWFIDGDALSFQALLERVAATQLATSVLESLPPPSIVYRQLRHTLADYRRLEQLGGWPRVLDGPLIRPGLWDDRIPVLRERLATEDPSLQTRYDSRHYDAPLQQAVKRFQARHGLEVDGIIGSGTLAALNQPVSDRIAQIRSNLERWRWMPRQLPERYLAVNLPAFELKLIDESQLVLSMRAIAGRADRPSPVFRSRVTRLIFNPEWTVPQTIVFKDILPRLHRDPDYLNRKRIRVLRHNGEGLEEVDPMQVNWGRYDEKHFPFLLRQASGEHNSLGRLKFEMPNPYEIYLHDTPNENLFRKNVRTLSSGCIRLEAPETLAGHLLNKDDPDAAITYVNSLIYSGTTSDKIVTPEIAVFLLYFTVWVDEEGVLHFRDDVYNRNAKLNALFTF